MTASASLPLLMDSPHNSSIRHVVVSLGLYLVALGGGGIRPCTSALGADQFDGADSVERVTKASFFNWYYFTINIGSLLSGTVLVWVQDNVGWGVGFLIPTVLMVFGLATFIAGRRVYRYKKLQGNPLKSVSQVIVAAARNCNLGLPEDCSAPHEVPSPSTPNCRIQHTSQSRYFSFI
jgi:peptide/histidine transporter 3/4